MSTQFFGQKVSKAGVNVAQAQDNQLVYKNDYNATTYYANDGSQVQVGNFLDNNTNGVRILDKNKIKVAQYGQQVDGSTNLKFFDNSGIGLAQFGKYADGTTALKVAKAGVEVATATNDQLIFNSNQDVFKIVKSGTASTASVTATPGGAGQWAYNTSNVIIAHGLTFTPLVVGDFLQGSLYGVIPNTVAAMVVANSPYFLTVGIVADATNINITATVLTLTGAYTLPALTVKYYLLQETAN